MLRQRTRASKGKAEIEKEEWEEELSSDDSVTTDKTDGQKCVDEDGKEKIYPSLDKLSKSADTSHQSNTNLNPSLDKLSKSADTSHQSNTNINRYQYKVSKSDDCLRERHTNKKECDVTDGKSVKKIDPDLRDHSDRASETEDNPLLPHFVVIIVIISSVCVVALIAAFLYSLPEISPKHSYNSLKEFENKMAEMKKIFPSQEDFFWNTLKNVGRRHLHTVHTGSKDDLRPLSFLVAGYAGSDETMTCFLSKLGEAFTYMPYVTMQSADYVSDISRKRFDDDIRSSLKNDQKFIIIQDINRLPFYSAQLFMTYSDAYSDIATFPQSTLILTASMPFSESNRHSDEARVATYFKDDVWSKEKNDDVNNVNNRAALWTRVGDGLVLLKTEKNNPCKY